MKTTLSCLLCIICFISACVQSPEADKTETGDIQETAAFIGDGYKIDTGTSIITWVGTKINGSHRGHLKIIEGTIGLNGNIVSGGNFTIDIHSLKNTDLPLKEKNKIETHLKSADFFDVKNYPTASFSISKVEKFNPDTHKSILPGATHTISGNLTLKGVTKNVTFPAKITMANNSLTALADFAINRTKWGMNYKGANNPQDWLIYKEVNIKLAINASK